MPCRAFLEMVILNGVDVALQSCRGKSISEFGVRCSHFIGLRYFEMSLCLEKGGAFIEGSIRIELADVFDERLNCFGHCMQSCLMPCAHYKIR